MRHELFLQKTEQVDALGTLNGHTQSSVPNQLDQGSKGTTHAESDGVVQWFLESIVVEQDARYGVDVRVRVFSLDTLVNICRS